MTEEDIKKQLEVKNKEIYENKLKLDLNNNMETLVLTIENLINKTVLETTNKILGIAESFHYKEEIEKDINKFFSKYVEYLMELLDSKKEKIILNIHKVNNYEDLFNKETNNILKELNNFYEEKEIILLDKIKNYYQDEFYKQRIENYLKINLKENLENKIKDTLIGRDLILLNTFKETYLKYLELNKNTIG